MNKKEFRNLNVGDVIKINVSLQELNDADSLQDTISAIAFYYAFLLTKESEHYCIVEKVNKSFPKNIINFFSPRIFVKWDNGSSSELKYSIAATFGVKKFTEEEYFAKRLSE